MNLLNSRKRIAAATAAAVLVIAAIASPTPDEQPDTARDLVEPTTTTSTTEPPETTTTTEPPTTTTEPPTTTTTSTTTTTAPPASAEPTRDTELTAWKLVIATEIPEVLSMDNESIESFIAGICDLANDVDESDDFLLALFVATSDTDFTPEQIGQLAGASIGLDCPDRAFLLGA